MLELQYYLQKMIANFKVQKEDQREANPYKIKPVRYGKAKN